MDTAGHILRKEQKGDNTYSLLINDQIIGTSSKDYVSDTINQSYVKQSALANSGPSIYIAQQGDTLQSIAKAVWGDATLWYLIADANGLATTEPQSGAKLMIPAREVAGGNRTDTFRPYNPREIVGDTTPNMPMPAGQDGCGGMGQIIMVVVAVVVTIYTAGAMTSGSMAFMQAMQAGAGALASAGTAGGIGIAVTAGAAGSIASQAVGIAIGAQKDFNWKGVALSAIGAGVTAGIGGLAQSGGMLSSLAGSDLPQVVGRAMLGNTITQGIGIATGLQQSFSWTNVAASGVGAGVGKQVGDWLSTNEAFGSNVVGGTEAQDYGARVARGTVSGFASGVAVAAMRGGKIEMAQIARDAFGNALGESLAAGNVSSGSGTDAGGAGGGSQESELTKFRKSEILAMNDAAEYGKARRYLRQWHSMMDSWVDGLLDPNPLEGLAPSQYMGPLFSEAGEFGGRRSGTQVSAVINTDNPTENVAGSVSRGTTQMSLLGLQGKTQIIGLTYKRSADDYIEMAQNTAEDYLMTKVDDAAVSSDNTARATAAMTYGFRKITSDTLKGIIGIPRTLTSDHVAPDLVNSIRHPIDTARQFAKAFGDMSVQDRWVTGLEIALPFKGNVDRLAGKIPGVGRYLEGDLSLRRGQGIILSTSEGEYSVRSPITWAQGEPGVLYTRPPFDIQNPFVAKPAWGTKEAPRMVPFIADDVSATMPHGDGWGGIHVNVEGQRVQFGIIENTPDGPQFFLEKTAKLPSGEIVKLNGRGFTNIALQKTISAYEEAFGVRPPGLPGSLALENLTNFQTMFAAARDVQMLGVVDAGQAAINRVSFGSARAALGYGKFSLDMSDFKDVIIKGRTLTNVPGSVVVRATPY